MSDKKYAALRFTITKEGAVNGEAGKTFTLEVGADTPVRIGRAPGNDIIVESRGVSQYHTELRCLWLDEDTVSPSLCVRDLSMNGTGVKRPGGKAPVHVEKQTNVPLEHGSVLLVPMLLKVSQSAQERAWLRVDIQGPVKAGDVAASTHAAQSRRHARDVTAAPAQPAVAPAGGSNGSGGGDEDMEKRRMRFVELLLKTREVSASTTYEEARKLLCSSADWHAVDEPTRKECFEIFVEHLGNHQSQKKRKKKKSKEKDEEKKPKKQKRSKEDRDEPAATSHKEAQHVAGLPESKGPLHGREREKKQRRARRGGSRSVSMDRGRKHEKRGSRRSRSHGAGHSPSGSPSLPKNNKRRHRDRSTGSR